MTSPTYPTDAEIHAYVDEALDPLRRDEVAAVLREDDELAARVSAYVADRDALRSALTAALLTPLPPAWQARIEAAGAMRTGNRRAGVGRRHVVATGLAVSAAATLVAVLGWTRGGGILHDAFAARDALAGTLADPKTSIDGARLRAGLGLPVQAPDLERFGFRLARLDLVAGHAAQMAYGDALGRRLTIFVRPSDGTPRFDLLRHGALRVCVWQDDVVGAVIIAPMSAGEMMRVATAAYASLNL